MMERICIRNGTIVTATETLVDTDLLVEEGLIVGIGRGLDIYETRVIDATGCYVIPGGVDAHTHLNLEVNGIKVDDGFFEGTAAAAFGGTTCIVEHPGFGPAGCSLCHQVERYQAEAADLAVVDYALHGVVQHTEGNVLESLQDLKSMGVPTVKVYLTYDGRLTDREILEVLKRTTEWGLLPTFHAENDAIIAFRKERFRREGKLTPAYHALSRPDYCEAEAIQRIIHLAEAADNAPVYIVHLSTAAGLKVIESARAKGLPVFAEVCPQHLVLDDSCYEEPNHGGLKYIMAPPARKKEDCAALWGGLATGSIDVVATDHCYFSFRDKLRLGIDDFSLCPGGIPGVETRLPLLFSEGVAKGLLSINRFVDLVSTTPAKIMGLYPRKGTLAPGSDGDVVIFDPTMEKTITPDALFHSADYSPYEGMHVRGWPVVTLVRGRVVMEKSRLPVEGRLPVKGHLRAEKGWGKYAARKLTS
jgi:dihydropyrimidinase